MLLEAMVGLYALFLGCGGLLAWAFQTLSHRLNALEAKIEAKIDASTNSPEILTTLKDSLTEVIEATLENMQPPTAFDHIAGAAVQFMQMKMMSTMETLNPLLESLEHDENL